MSLTSYNEQIKTIPHIKESRQVNMNRNHIIIAIVVGIVNVMFYNNFLISFVLVAIECLTLIYFLTKKRVVDYLGYYLIFLSLSQEFDILVGSDQFYGFKNFRIFGVNIAIIMLLPILLLIIQRKINVSKLKRTSKSFYSIIISFITLTFTGLFFGAFQILINDNNIQTIDNLFSNFIGSIYSMAIIPGLLILFFIFFINEECNIDELKSFLISTLIALVVSLFFALSTEIYGYYGGLKTLLVPVTSIYIPFLILFALNSGGSKKIALLSIWTLGSILLLIFNSSGKLIIIYFLLPFLIIFSSIRKKKYISMFLTFFLIASIAFAVVLRINAINNDFPLLSIKLNQVTSMMKFWTENWLAQMPLSPKIRILEFVNIFFEYVEKPWLIIFGKGYLGTFTDHSMLMGTTYIPGSFSIAEWNHGVFFGVHETLNVLFLNHGLFGLFILTALAIYLIKHSHKSPWLIIGGVWFLFFYGYSLTLSSFGITSLLIGILDIDIS